MIKWVKLNDDGTTIDHISMVEPADPANYVTTSYDALPDWIFQSGEFVQAAITTDTQLTKLDIEFERKKSALVARKATTELTDGVSMAAKISAIQAEYAALVAEYNAAVDLLLFS